MPSLTAPVPRTGPAVVPLTEQKKECRERGGEITRGVGIQKRLANGLGPPPCSLHYRVERSCGPRFVGACLPAYAKSLGLAFVRAPWRRLCRAGGVTRTGVGRGGASTRTAKEKGGVIVSRRSGGARHAEGGVGYPCGPVLSRAPLAAQDQGVSAAGTTPGGEGWGRGGLGDWRRAGFWALE